MLRRDTLHIGLDAAVTKTASYAPPAKDYNLDRYNELVITLNITAAERTTTQTYDFYVITGDGSSEWDLVHFPQIVVAGPTKLTARVLSSLLPETVTPAAPGVSATAAAVINTLTTNAPKTLGAGLIAHGPWGNYLRYELVCVGPITTGIAYTLQVEASWGSARAAAQGASTIISAPSYYYRAIQIDHTKCGAATSSNFPVLVNITGAASIKTVANGGRINNTGAQAGGAGGTIPYDLVFSSDSAGTSKYPWEVESYNGATGDLVAWVNVPTIPATSGSDFTFYMVYGIPAMSTQQNVGSFAPANVWDASYKGVWHLSNNAGALSGKDSTSGAHHAATVTATAAVGKVDGGSNHDGTPANKILIPNHSDFNFTTGNFSLELWLNPSGLGTENGTVVINFGHYQVNGWDIFVARTGAPGKIYFEMNSAGVNSAAESNAGLVTSGSWQHLVCVRTGTNSVAIYWNGVSQTIALNNFGSAASNTTIDLSIGCENSTNTNFANGQIDEVRISNTARSASWILTAYNNQNAAGNIGTPGFLTFGAETSS